MPIRPDVDEMIDFLNQLLKIDPSAINQLVFLRTPCNEELANHPTVQVVACGSDYSVGLLGILNGYFGTIDGGPFEGWGAIVAAFDEDGTISSFKRLES